MAMTSSEEAEVADRQHTKPCHDCPWRRTALNGWLGRMTADEWVRAAHGEATVECHTKLGAQCAGLAIYRGNICKLPHDPNTLLLPADRKTVFANPDQFREHHSKPPTKGSEDE